MMVNDTYKTISKHTEGLFRDKGSRFIAMADPVATIDETRLLLDKYRKSYHDARHHCFAWMIGYDRKNFRANDDGEPSGTAGKPILGQINSNKLTNVMITVIRYFGGTLLGTPGLINAYRSAAVNAIAKAKIETRTVCDFYLLEFPYLSMNDTLKIVKEEKLNQYGKKYGSDCSIEVGIRASQSERILRRLRGVENLKMQFIRRA